MNNKKIIRQYVLLSIALSWGLFGSSCYYLFIAARPSLSQSSLIAITFIPSVITFLLTKHFRLGWKGFSLELKNWRFLLYAVVLVLVYALAENVIQQFTHTKSFAMLREKYVLVIFILAPLASVFTSVFSLGEEVGWRGFLQNMFIKEFGLLKGISLLAFVWILWHLPLALLGYHLPDYPVIEAFILGPVILYIF